jgi:hypothetical protein
MALQQVKYKCKKRGQVRLYVTKTFTQTFGLTGLKLNKGDVSPCPVQLKKTLKKQFIQNISEI